MKHQEDEMGEAHATAEIVNVNNGMQQPMHVEDLDFSMEKRGAMLGKEEAKKKRTFRRITREKGESGGSKQV